MSIETEPQLVANAHLGIQIVGDCIAVVGIVLRKIAFASSQTSLQPLQVVRLAIDCDRCSIVGGRLPVSNKRADRGAICDFGMKEQRERLKREHNTYDLMSEFALQI